MILRAFESEAPLFVARFQVGFQILVLESILFHQAFDPGDPLVLIVFSNRHTVMVSLLDRRQQAEAGGRFL